MGATHSIPSQPERDQFPTTSPPRNKLTKPRTNSNTRETSCLPSLTLSLSRSNFLGHSKPSPSVKPQMTVEDQSTRDIFTLEYSQITPPMTANGQSGSSDLLGDYVSNHPIHTDTLHLNSISALGSTSVPAVVSSMLVSSGIIRRGSMITRSSTNSSSTCAPPPNHNPEISSMGTVRRRSQLLAAPPATATRKPAKSHRNSIDISDISANPFTLAFPQENDIGRCTTPSGYSVLGDFKRGSLRIANGAASPVPSSCPGSPDTSTKTDLSTPTLVMSETSNGRASRVKPLAVVTNPAINVHEIRLVPPSPTELRRATDERIPGSPFSFVQSPSICDEDILNLPLKGNQTSDYVPEDLRPLACGQGDRCQSLVSTTSSTISTGIDYPGILVEKYLNRHSGKTVCDQSNTMQTAYLELSTGTKQHHNVFSGKVRKGNYRGHRRPGMNKTGSEGTDSGYSSSGSVKSREPARSERDMDVDSNARKLETPQPTPKANSVPVARGEEVVRAMDKISSPKGMVAAIRRRYSQGDLKALARDIKFTNQPPLPTVPVLERKRTLTKPRPELKHRRSMIAVTKSPIQQLEIREPFPDIAPVPPLPHPSNLERKSPFNTLTPEDYLPLVGDLSLIPAINHIPDIGSISSIGIETNTQEPVIKIEVGRGLYRGSRITGQDYYQRFSKARVGVMVK